MLLLSCTDRYVLTICLYIVICDIHCFGKIFAEQKSFEDEVNVVYAKLSRCLVGLKSRITYTDSLQRHYDDIYKFTAQVWKLAMRSYISFLLTIGVL
jgi:hypothetical protein